MEEPDGTGNGGRVTLRDLHSGIYQLRTEVIANLSEERSARHELANRIMALELFKAGMEETLRGEVRRAEDVHTDLEESQKLLMGRVDKLTENIDKFVDESRENRLLVRVEIDKLESKIQGINRKLAIAIGVVVTAANLLAPIILKIVFAALGVPST